MLANILLLFASATTSVTLVGTRMLDTTSTIRLEAVHADLQERGIPTEYFAALLIDPRLTIASPPMISTSTTTSTPPKPIDWEALRTNLISKKALAEGKTFIATYPKTMAKAEKMYGVSRYAIAGVIGIETRFGANTGRTPVFSYFTSGLLNARTTWSWQQSNLVALVEYCYKSKIDCMAVKGSSSGAIGWSQFLPYSIIEWGKDADQSGAVDLFNGQDAILSTANFLKEHGWGKTTASRHKALARYYGSSTGYPDIVLDYGEALKKR